jgi:hypothetical protein
VIAVAVWLVLAAYSLDFLFLGNPPPPFPEGGGGPAGEATPLTCEITREACPSSRTISAEPWSRIVAFCTRWPDAIIRA